MALESCRYCLLKKKKEFYNNQTFLYNSRNEFRKINSSLHSSSHWSIISKFDLVRFQFPRWRYTHHKRWAPVILGRRDRVPRRTRRSRAPWRRWERAAGARARARCPGRRCQPRAPKWRWRPPPGRRWPAWRPLVATRTECHQLNIARNSTAPGPRGACRRSHRPPRPTRVSSI